MPPPVYSSKDYLTQFQRLLPRGRVWHRSLGMVEDAMLEVLMPTWARLHVRLNDLIGEIFPCTTLELLPEWEDTLGLPDPCVGPLDSVQQRVAAVCAKFTARGGQSKEYFIRVAASLGQQILIQEFTPFQASRNRAGEPVYDEKWAYAWHVTAAAAEIEYFTASLSVAGDPLATYGSKALECMFEALKPAHTAITITYGSQWDDGQSLWDNGSSIWDAGEL